MSYKFKFIKVDADRTLTYCDTADHILIVPPLNAHAQENYGVDTKACDCVEAPKEPVTETE